MVGLAKIIFGLKKPTSRKLPYFNFENRLDAKDSLCKMYVLYIHQVSHKHV